MSHFLTDGPRVLLAWLFVCAVVTEAAAICGEDVVSRCLAYWNADAVFVGRVRSIERREIRVREEFDSAEETLQRGDEVRLTVVDGFRGVSTPEVTVWNEFHAEAVRFEIGQEYFVYGHWSSSAGRLSVSGCDTSTVAESVRDLEYARWIRTGPAGGRLGGAVSHSQWDPERNEHRGYRLPPGLTATVAGEGRSWTATIGKDGTFELDVPLGTYDVTVNAPQPLVAERLEPFEVAPPGRCYKRYIQLWWPGTIRGRVVDTEGRPVPRCGVTIVSKKFAGLAPDEYQIQEIVTTDDRGEFVHDRLAPGEYLVGIHIDSQSRDDKLPVFYHPGVMDVAESPALEVTLESPVDVGDFRLPVAVRKTPVEGVVLMPDGSPAAEASVGLYSEDRAFDAPELYTSTDANGRFVLHGLAGRRYDLSAGTDRDGSRFDGSARVIAGGSAPIIVRLAPSF